MKKDSNQKDNIHTSREEWLREATNQLRPYFEMFGHSIPDNIRFAIAFTSGGKRGMEGECWHPQASADKHFEIIIKADKADPLEILGILTRELIHTLLPPAVKYGREFRDIALRIGLEGNMTRAMPAPPLQERLKVIATALGPIPHATLDFASGAGSRRKQGVRMLKAECGASCGYTVRIIPKWVKVGLPVCPVDPAHGRLRCESRDDKKVME
ncbi:MAG: transcription elongation protein SprT [Alphaproteobacteria bacterium]